MALIALAGVALVLSWALGAGDQPLPSGSSLSYEPAGTRALYQWVGAMGGQVQRIETRPLSLPETNRPETLFIVQPETFISPAERIAIEAAVRRGATVVVAADTPAGRALLLSFGISLEPIAGAPVIRADTGETLPWMARTRIVSRSLPAEPLLVTATGDAVTIRAPFQGEGGLVAMGDTRPLSNDGLRNDALARWAHHAIVAPIVARGDVVLFDETHFRTAPSAGTNPAGFRDLVLASTPGRALLLALGVTLMYLLLGGRRLGPSLPPASPWRTARTMAEQVQAVASLYRRARQLSSLRQHYTRHYRRLVSRAIRSSLTGDATGAVGMEELLAHGVPARQASALAGALAILEGARSERELLSAVRTAEAVLQTLPRATRTPLPGSMVNAA